MSSKESFHMVSTGKREMGRLLFVHIDSRSENIHSHKQMNGGEARKKKDNKKTIINCYCSHDFMNSIMFCLE